MECLKVVDTRRIPSRLLTAGISLVNRSGTNVGSLRLVEAYNHLCAGVALLNVSDRISRATQWITLINL